ncbi:hypothetical protein [Halopenitus sp. POP-27]|uniref:hypothetical protein n=1 Tax=Halopenitus sp. POP-27 TaxID=2994425 RepID=UPI00246849E3|nr:hypothetical protein [Halopenitus sp. POP-27]
MTHYPDGHLGHISDIKRAAQEERDPHRRAMLWNYLHHAALEVSGDWEAIFDPELIVDDPQYEMRLGTEEPLVLDGTEEVKAFYEAGEEDVFLLSDEDGHQLFVNEWGIADLATYVEFLSGDDLIADGLDKPYYRNDVAGIDPDAMYQRTCRQAMFWPYDDDACLIGEQVYQLEPFAVERVDPDAVPTVEEIASITEPYYPENTAGPTPVRSDT